MYFTAFLPYSLLTPLVLYQEIFCATFILLLIYFFALDKLMDLVYLLLFSLVALLSDFSLFWILYLVFIFTVTFQKIQEKKSQTTVFFKKKNIPFRILIGYSGFLIFIIIIFILTDFFGPSSFLYLSHHLFEFSLGILPVFFSILALRLILNLDFGTPDYAASFTLLVLSIAIGYYSFIKPQGENLDSIRKIESEYVSLRKTGKIPAESRLYVKPSLRNYLYYREGLPIETDIAVEMKIGDYFLLEDLPPTARSYLDKKNIPTSIPAPYYFLPTNNTLLLSKTLADRVLSESEESELGKSIKQLKSQLVLPQLTFYQRWNRFFGKFFGI